MFLIKKHQLYWFLLSLFVPFFVFQIIGVSQHVFFNIAALIIMLTSLWGISAVSDKPFTLAKMVYVFNFFFFGVVPLNDLVNNNIYWGGTPLSTESYHIAIFIIALVNVVFLFLNITFDNVFSQKVFHKKLKEQQRKNVNKIFYKAVLLFVFMTYLILYFADFNIYKVLFRGLIDDTVHNAKVTARPLSMLVDYVLKPMPLVTFLVLRWKLRGNYLSSFQKVLMVILFVVSIILVSPTSVPRFLAAALYISLILSLTKFWKTPYLMCCGMIASLLIVFPFLNNFRHYDSELNVFAIDFDFLNHGHFDAFQNLVRVIDINMISMGYQLLGSLFFFIPRSLWNSKPIGSGHTLAQNADLSFSNISMPFIAEGFVNFGLFGVFLFISTLALVVSFVDAKFWAKGGDDDKGIVFYHLSFGLVFFIMRGDLLSGAAFFFGLYFCFRMARTYLN